MKTITSSRTTPLQIRFQGRTSHDSCWMSYGMAPTFGKALPSTCRKCSTNPVDPASYPCMRKSSSILVICWCVLLKNKSPLIHWFEDWIANSDSSSNALPWQSSFVLVPRKWGEFQSPPLENQMEPFPKSNRTSDNSAHDDKWHFEHNESGILHYHQKKIDPHSNETRRRGFCSYESGQNSGFLRWNGIE